MLISHLVKNLLTGLRLALFLPVQRSDFRAGLGLSMLAVLASAALLGVASYLDQEHEVFVNIYGVLSLVVFTFMLFLVALTYVRSQGSLELFPDMLTTWAYASPFLVIGAFAALDISKDYVGQGPVLIGLLVWAVSVATRGALLVYPEASTRSRTLLGFSLIGFSSVIWKVGLVPALFFSYDAELYDDYVMIDQEATYFRQTGLLDRELNDVANETPGVTDVYFLGFAGNGDESVFQSEAEFAASAIDRKYGTMEKSVVLSNDADNLSTRPLANSYNLFETIRRLGAKMDVSEDILFVFLTSHGSKDATIDVSLYPFQFAPVSAQDLMSALDESGVVWRVIVVSACYAGSFVDYLKDDHTAIFTAASADRTSFGCSDERELTYFGEAFFRDGLGEGGSLVDSFDRAVTIIEERESSEGINASNPQKFVGEFMAQKLEDLSAVSDN